MKTNIRVNNTIHELALDLRLTLLDATTLVDLMKIDVVTPDTVVDVRPLEPSSIDVSEVTQG